ncbi:14-3-3-like protein D [Morella rubra]|uniref:14-3-3-like protein D n=1 Tax=Morella rubra TaxID=262757 RepID=A0A6A1VAA1_9ROSI|nr:14-3-3-like protein D [Morella rubra]
MASRKDFIYLAKLAELAERYDEMADAMKEVAILEVELTVEERNLFFVGFKNKIAGPRASWRALSSIEQKEEAKGNGKRVKQVKEYKQKVESELSSICNDMLRMLDEHLIPSASAGESTLFYHKMRGDYYRYLAEFKTGEEYKEAVDQSMKAYETATAMAEADLPPTHRIRLAVALNFSVFYYEIMNSHEKAFHLAKFAYDEAIPGLKALSEDSYRDSTFIMEKLKDNLVWWTYEQLEDGHHIDCNGCYCRT